MIRATVDPRSVCCGVRPYEPERSTKSQSEKQQAYCPGFGGTTVSIHLHVDDADAVLERAEKAGGTIVRAATDQFYGERSGTVRDPFGHHWIVATHIRDVPEDEMVRAFAAMFGE